jgi:thiol-disulfide isomerase/thioredoxin
MKKTSVLLAALMLAAPAAPVRAQGQGILPEPDFGRAKILEDASPSKYKTADELWARLQELNNVLKASTGDKQKFLEALKANDDAVKEFLKRFPDDKHKWEVKIAEAQISAIFARAGAKGYDPDKMQSVAKEIVAAPDAPANLKQDARFALLARSIREHADMAKIEAGVTAYATDYPDDARSATLKFLFTKELRGTDPARAETLFKDLAKNKNPQIADFSQAELTTLGMRNKPLDWKFTAVDDRKVDMSALHGKVVLVDFWAAAFRPSVLQIPEIAELCKKYGGNGFEVVGISLDKDKQALLAAIKDRGITWPQYFDGKGVNNDISSAAGIRSIPRLWLVNKNGILVNIDAGKNIEAEIEKLLAE